MHIHITRFLYTSAHISEETICGQTRPYSLIRSICCGDTWHDDMYTVMLAHIISGRCVCALRRLYASQYHSFLDLNTATRKLLKDPEKWHIMRNSEKRCKKMKKQRGRGMLGYYFKNSYKVFSRRNAFLLQLSKNKGSIICLTISPVKFFKTVNHLTYTLNSDASNSFFAVY
jgi:hypothetical protein